MSRKKKPLVAFILMTAFTPHVHSQLRENIEYGQAGGASLRLDARIPDGTGPYPAAIIVHGGAWVAGDRRVSVLPLFQPLSDARIATFSISYRLAGPGPDGFKMSNDVAQILTLGTAIDDVRQAVTFVKSRAAEFRVDPERVVLIGESAGAQLASMAALRPGTKGAVRGVVAFYCPSDLVKFVQTSVWIPDNIRRALKGSPLETLLFAGLRDLSPVTWVSQGAPPFLLIHGTADTLVPFDQSTAFCDRLHEAGARCDLYPVAGGHHGLRRWESVGLTDYKEQMIRWLQRTFPSSSAAPSNSSRYGR
jgi:acetyl esterase